MYAVPRRRGPQYRLRNAPGRRPASRGSGRRRPRPRRLHRRVGDAHPRRTRRGRRGSRRFGRRRARHRRDRFEQHARGALPPSAPRTPAPTPCSSSRRTTTSPNSAASLTTSRPSPTRSTVHRSSTTSPRTGQNIEPDTAVELASHPNILGYKAASGDMNQISEIIERTRDEEFSVLSGDDGMTLPMLSVGAHGCISVAANVEPERDLRDGRRRGRRRLRARPRTPPRTRAAVPRPLRRDQPIPVKGGDADPRVRPRPRPPALSRLADEYVDDLDSILAELENPDGEDAFAEVER